MKGNGKEKISPLAHRVWTEKWPKLSSYIAFWAMANSLLVKLRKLKVKF